MRKIILFLFIFFCTYLYSSAQSAVVTGSVNDTAEHKKLTNAVITLVKKQDSTLVQFTRTDKDGNFVLQSIPYGQYVMMVSFPKFADYIDDVTVKDSTVQVGAVALTLKSLLLKEVVIRTAGAIRIKGDTTEYVADSFMVKEGATVEDLLKRLPGFQVNSKGEVTAQGQKVQKVLVDGEEFFGDDPTMATQNISAKAVDKVQVFDTKSEQQQITGISTGTEGKTVNIKLKEDKKKGAFGKAEAGSNFDNITDAKVLYNRFLGKKKTSAYGTKSNTSTGSLNWEERQKLGIENDFEYDEISGFYNSFGGGDDFNDWSLRGLPNSYSAGGLFINKWDADKKAVNASYRFNRLGTYNEASVLTQNLLQDTTYYSNRYTTTHALTQQQAGSFKYEWKVDSLTSFKITSALTYKTNTSNNNTLSEFLDEGKNIINNNNRLNTVDATKLQSDNQLVYRQLFKKPNRLLLATLRLGVVNDDQDNFLISHTNFYKNGNVDSVQNIDQEKINKGNSTTMGGKITFSEPLTKTWALITEYAYNKNNATSALNTYDKSFNGKYESRNNLYSNNFDMDVNANSLNVVSRYTGKKLRLAVGSGLSAINLNLLNKDNNIRTKYNFTNITPQSSISYAFKQQTRLGVNYRGTTQQPSINQLQPLRDNNDPLNIFVGNPALKVAFNHNISIFYNSYKILAQRGIWLNLGYNATQNAITNANVIDASGRRTYSPVNVNGNHYFYYYSEWNHGEGEKKLNFLIRFNGNGGQYVSFINKNKSLNNYGNHNMALGFRYEVAEKYNINVVPKLGYNLSKNSLQPNLKNNYFNYGANIDGMVHLPWKLQAESNLNIDLRQRIQAFSRNTNMVIWNASVARKVLKDKSGKVSIVANDILNQNKGFSRNLSSYAITDERYLRISRYVLLKFEWSFNKMPGATK